MKKITSPTLFAFALLATPGQAFAYLDAGTGSMIIQGIIGAVVAGLYIVKMYWHRLLTFLGVRKRPEDEPAIEAEKTIEGDSDNSRKGKDDARQHS